MGSSSLAFYPHTRFCFLSYLSIVLDRRQHIIVHLYSHQCYGIELSSPIIVRWALMCHGIELSSPIHVFVSCHIYLSYYLDVEIFESYVVSLESWNWPQIEALLRLRDRPTVAQSSNLILCLLPLSRRQSSTFGRKNIMKPLPALLIIQPFWKLTRTSNTPLWKLTRTCIIPVWYLTQTV